MGNSRCKRLHCTLKACLEKLCIDKPRDWDRYIIPTLFALREIPSDRSGFSAFELLYGRQVRGRLAVLRDLWEDKSLADEKRTLYQYVLELQQKLQDYAKISVKNTEISVQKYKTYFDLTSQDRQFAPGDEVLLLLPDTTNKLLVAWKGPFTVIERRNHVNYVINCDGVHKQFHANLLKKYHRRANVNFMHIPVSTGTDYFPVRADPLFNCQPCVDDNNSISEITADEDEVSILPPMVTVKTE